MEMKRLRPPDRRPPPPARMTVVTCGACKRPVVDDDNQPRVPAHYCKACGASLHSGILCSGVWQPHEEGPGARTDRRPRLRLCAAYRSHSQTVCLVRDEKLSHQYPTSIPQSRSHSEIKVHIFGISLSYPGIGIPNVGIPTHDTGSS